MSALPAVGNIAPPLLEWYKANRRVLPFREEPTAYNVWVSEIMLQQTRMSAVLPYYERFTAALPGVPQLAECDEQQLHKLWQGLGYYNRVRNMQKAARLVIEKYGGVLPASYEALLALPGIGPYTAGAIASIAYGLPVVAVDGNVLRVFSRLYASEEDITRPDVKKRLAALVARQQPGPQAGDYNQALMELGALVCQPGAPRCEACPLAGICAGFARGVAAALPVAAPKKPKETQAMCVIVARQGPLVLLRRRPDKGLLAGLWEPLTFAGSLTKAQAQTQLAQLVPGAALAAPLPKARHVFTHKIWQLYGWQAKLPAGAQAPPGCVLASADELRHRYALPAAFDAYRPAMGQSEP